MLDLLKEKHNKIQLILHLCIGQPFTELLAMFYTSRQTGVAHLGRKMLTNKNAHAINFHQRQNRTTNQNVNTANFRSKIIVCSDIRILFHLLLHIDLYTHIINTRYFVVKQDQL